MKQRRPDEIRTLWHRAKACENIITQGRMDAKLLGTIPQLLDTLEEAQTENERLRAALSELEQSCRWNTIMHAGEPQYSTDECSVCGTQFDSRVEGKHREHCPFAVLVS